MKLREFMMSMDKVRTAIEQSVKQCFWLGKGFEEPKVEVDMSCCTQMMDADGYNVDKLSDAYQCGSICVRLGKGFDCTLYGMKRFLEEMDVQPQELKQDESFFRETMLVPYGKDEDLSLELWFDAERMFEKFG